MLSAVQLQTLLLVVERVQLSFDLVVSELPQLQLLALFLGLLALELLSKLETAEGHVTRAEGRVDISEIELSCYHELAALTHLHGLVGDLIPRGLADQYSVALLSDRLQEYFLNFPLQAKGIEVLKIRVLRHFERLPLRLEIKLGSCSR